MGDQVIYYGKSRDHKRAGTRATITRPASRGSTAVFRFEDGREGPLGGVATRFWAEKLPADPEVEAMRAEVNAPAVLTRTPSAKINALIEQARAGGLEVTIEKPEGFYSEMYEVSIRHPHDDAPNALAQTRNAESIHLLASRSPVEQLEARIAKLEEERDRIKAFNATARKGVADLSLLNERERRNYEKVVAHSPYSLGKGGQYPSYHLSNLSGNIKRQRDRLAQLRREQAKRVQDLTEGDGLTSAALPDLADLKRRLLRREVLG